MIFPIDDQAYHPATEWVSSIRLPEPDPRTDLLRVDLSHYVGQYHHPWVLSGARAFAWHWCKSDEVGWIGHELRIVDVFFPWTRFGFCPRVGSGNISESGDEAPRASGRAGADSYTGLCGRLGTSRPRSAISGEEVGVGCPS